MSRGSLALVISLAAIAGVVVGGERPAGSAIAQNAAPAEDLDVARLARPRSDGAAPDLFENPSFAPPPPPPPPPAAMKPEPPPAPVAPPLPFTYLGRMQKGERSVVYLLRQQDMVLAEAGETIDNTYRVEQISETVVQFVYLPLGTRQTLNVPARP